MMNLEKNLDINVDGRIFKLQLKGIDEQSIKKLEEVFKNKNIALSDLLKNYIQSLIDNVNINAQLNDLLNKYESK